MKSTDPKRETRTARWLGVAAVVGGMMALLWLTSPAGGIPSEFFWMDVLILLLTLSVIAGTTRWTNYGKSLVFETVNATLLCLIAPVLMGFNARAIILALLIGGAVLGLRVTWTRRDSTRREKL